MNKIKILYNHIERRRHIQLIIVVVFMVLSSMAEVMSLGAVLPFLGVLSSPDYIYEHHLMQPFIEFLQIDNSSQLLLPITIVFIFLALFSGIIRLILMYVMTRLSYAIGADLSINIYRRTLYQEYIVHIGRNSSEVINGVVNKANSVISNVINPILVFISSTIFIISIIATLFVIDFATASSISISLGFIYFLVVYFTRKKLQENSECVASQSTEMIKSLQEGLGSIRDVLINNAQIFYCDMYRNSDILLRRASANSYFISNSPKYILESVGIAIIAGIAYSIASGDGGVNEVIPLVGGIALGMQRLLPILQAAYGSYSLIKGASASFSDTLELLNQPLPEYANQLPEKPILFEDEIKLSNLSFRYDRSTPWVLKDVNLVIKKGMNIGFVGKTGSGKSTLLDILMGLLYPTTGQLTIDGKIVTLENIRSWRAHISHVPQSIYLMDAAIEENIALGTLKDKINHGRVEAAAKKADIHDLIMGYKDQYKTIVGERGMRLSGGQRQRIGIARALYRKANVLIFDEATSALDGETEKSVMKNIEKLDSDLTVLVIAHRLTTLEKCDVVIELKDGKTTIKKNKTK